MHLPPEPAGMDGCILCISSRVVAAGTQREVTAGQRACSFPGRPKLCREKLSLPLWGRRNPREGQPISGLLRGTEILLLCSLLRVGSWLRGAPSKKSLPGSRSCEPPLALVPPVCKQSRRVMGFFGGEKKKSFVSFRSHLETRHQERARRAACSGPIPLWALQPSPPAPRRAVDERKSFVWLSQGCSVRFLFVHFYFCLFSLPYPCSDPAIPAPEEQGASALWFGELDEASAHHGSSSHSRGASALLVDISNM